METPYNQARSLVEPILDTWERKYDFATWYIEQNVDFSAASTEEVNS